MQTRDDHVVTVNYPDNSVVVEHADGTRISTVMQDVSTVTSTADTLETGSFVALFNNNLDDLFLFCGKHH